MNRIKALFPARTNIAVFLALLIVATLAPYARNQFVTGSIVNGTLLFAVCYLGIRSGLLISIIPSTIALATGVLPAPLAPMIPFIILGNTVLVISFDYLKKINYWLGAISGAVLKFGLLTGMASVVTHLITNKNAAANVAYMMNWPQLVTALAGSLLVFGLLSFKKKPANH
jgi:hypothetical protein